MSRQLRAALATLIPDSTRAACRALRGRLLWHWIVHARSRPCAVTAGPLLVIAPHQDDETFGCGGLIARKRAQGVPVQVVFLTDGRRSHDAHPELGATRAEVVDIRQEEARAALDILGVTPINTFFLGQADGELTGLPPMQREQAIADIAARMEAFQPEDVCVPHRNDNHPDHQAAYALALAALARWGRPVRLLQYPVWLFWWRSIPLVDLKMHELAGAHHLPLTDVYAQKQRAISAYASQAAILPPGFLGQFQIPYELFFCSEEFLRRR